MSLDVVTIAGADRGLAVSDMQKMEIGQIVDYVEQYNEMHDYDTGTGSQEEGTRRIATQEDWNALMG